MTNWSRLPLAYFVFFGHNPHIAMIDGYASGRRFDEMGPEIGRMER